MRDGASALSQLHKILLMSFTSIFIPTGAKGPIAISTNGTTQELDPADSPIIHLTSTTADDKATLPVPQKRSAKVQESGSFVIPKVIIGQYINLKLVVDGGSLAVTTTDATGSAMTLTFAEANDEIVLVATEKGYAILKNECVAVS